MKTSAIKIFTVLVSASLVLVSCKKEGCTDPVAVNYNSSANHDDGSCTFDANGGNGGNGGATTVITENVTTPTTWSGNISVCDDITVSSALVIEEGTVITMFASARIGVNTSGSLPSIGSAAPDPRSSV